jgi:hypothetical protein
MMPLHRAIEEYLELRRALGFKVRRMAENLPNFATFMGQRSASYITTELALEWATQPVDISLAIGRNGSALCAFLHATGTLPTCVRRFPL